MGYGIGALCGLVWGAAIALLNAQISRRCIAKNSTAALMSANFIRAAIDIAALAAVFLLRKRLPFSYEAALIATAIAMSLVTIVCAYRMSAQLRTQTDEQKDENEKTEP